MASDPDSSFGNTAVRMLINVAALGVSAGIIAIVVAMIIVEID